MCVLSRQNIFIRRQSNFMLTKNCSAPSSGTPDPLPLSAMGEVLSGDTLVRLSPGYTLSWFFEQELEAYPLFSFKDLVSGSF